MKRTLNLILSDLHIGNATKSRRTGGRNFGAREERRRLASVVEQTCAYKERYRKDTVLNVWALGDLGRGEIHAGGDRMSEQITRQIELLTSACRAFGKAFAKTSVYCVTGNHGRFMTKHPERGVDDKTDSFETIVYNTLKSAHKNVAVHVPETPYVDANVYGFSFLATHGDTMFKLPNPGGSINIGRIEAKVNRFAATRFRPDVVMVGHHHCPTVQVLPSGATLIVNGALCPSDEFCLSVDIPETPSAQVLFESTEDYAVGDLRVIRLGDEQDGDASLDRVLR